MDKKQETTLIIIGVIGFILLILILYFFLYLSIKEVNKDIKEGLGFVDDRPIQEESKNQYNQENEPNKIIEWCCKNYDQKL